MSEVGRLHIVSASLPLECRHCGQEVRWRGPADGPLLVHMSNRSMYCTLTSTTHAELEDDDAESN